MKAEEPTRQMEKPLSPEEIISSPVYQQIRDFVIRAGDKLMKEKDAELLKAEQELESQKKTSQYLADKVHEYVNDLAVQEEKIRYQKLKISELEETIKTKDAKLETILKALGEIRLLETEADEQWIEQVLRRITDLLNTSK